MSQAQPRPGSIVTTRTAPPPRSIPTDTGVWFVAGLSDKGPLKPVKVGSLQEFINNMGGRVTYSILYDAMETFFREGGSSAIVSRVVGPTPVIATVNLNSAAAAISLVVKAKGPGAYGNTLRVTVTGGGGAGPGNPFTLTIADTVLGTLETSPSLATQAEAVAWSQTSSWVDITLGAAPDNPAAVASAALTTGTDDRVNIVDAQWAAALARFTKDLGPGQVSAPGRTTTTGHAQVRDHAAANNRVALLDAPDSAVVATVTAAATSARGTNDQYAAMFAPWVVVPGVVAGTTRVVPPCAFVAGKIGKLDSQGNSPNKPAAGFPEGVADWASSLSQVPYDSGVGIDMTRDAMYDAGINQLAIRFGLLQVFGWRSLTSPTGAMQDWINLGNVRLNMAIVARSLAIAEGYILDELTLSRIKQFQGDLMSMLAEYYRIGSLFGETPEEAFVVDVGPSVNTLASIQNRELHASIGVRMTQDAELVVVEISKVPVTQSL